MTSRLRVAGLTRVAFLCLLVAPSCARNVSVERRPDGIYHLKCKAKLQVCLDEAENVCGHQRYAVVRAFDALDYKGDTALPEEFRSSEAYVRCGSRASWGDENKALMDQAVCPPAVAPPPALPPTPPPTACIPGTSAACVGPAGCKGGQVCAPDGATFGPCDCGPPTAPTHP